MQGLLRAYVKQIRAAPLPAGDRSATALVAAFYEQRGFHPAWTRPAQVEAQIRIAERTAREHGLNPSDYGAAALRRTWANVQATEHPTARQLAEMDLALTRSLVRFANDTRHGAVRPEDLDPGWNTARPDLPVGVGFVDVALATEDPGRFLEGSIRLSPFYLRLKRSLARHRKIAISGGWPAVPAGDTLERGARGPRVTSLRARLHSSGDLPASTVADRSLFDAALAAAVVRFQERHGLDPDGIVGPATLAALNVPVEARIDQIRVNMERLRWVDHDLPDTYLVVDIAGFKASVVKHGKTVWSSRVQVGRPYRETPVFRATMSHVVLNPTWTVPPSIQRDLIPSAKADPGFLAARNLSVVNARGTPVPVNAVDWNAVTPDRFPYMLRQEPGPRNPLGRIKFLFPNRHSVTLHDTPSKRNFRASARAFSSGCIRVERPLELAELVLGGSRGWSRRRIERTLESGRSRDVPLPEPLPVLLVYWTTEVDGQGRTHFRPDLYGRDRRVLRAMEAKPPMAGPGPLPEGEGGEAVRRWSEGPPRPPGEERGEGSGAVAPSPSRTQLLPPPGMVSRVRGEIGPTGGPAAVP